MSECVLLNSGGIDSRVTAALLADIGWTTHSLFVDWNASNREVQSAAAAETARLYCADHAVLSYAGVDWQCLSPKQGKRTTPYATVTTTMLGVQYAQFLGIDHIFNGSKREANNDRDWVPKLQDVVWGNTMYGPKFISYPLLNKSDPEIMELAARLGVDLTTTVSCPEYPPCGTCTSCIRRKGLGL